jgi:hypothetical protein
MATDHKIEKLLWDEYDKFKVIPNSRRVKSQADFARHLEVAPPDLSRWISLPG